MSRCFILSTAVLLGLIVATPVVADTLSEVTSHGIVLTLGDMDIDVTYTPDHKFTAMEGQVTGAWRIDGDKLCTTTPEQGETCSVYPADKKSGDTFEVSSEQGSAKVRIK